MLSFAPLHALVHPHLHCQRAEAVPVSAMKYTMCLAACTFLFAPNHTTAADKPATPALKVHPKVFNLVDCWISDSEAPVVTEFNLDALEANGNQFFADDVKKDGLWTRSPNEDGTGFFRYRVLETKGNQ